MGDGFLGLGNFLNLSPKKYQIPQDFTQISDNEHEVTFARTINGNIKFDGGTYVRGRISEDTSPSVIAALNLVIGKGTVV